MTETHQNRPSAVPFFGKRASVTRSGIAPRWWRACTASSVLALGTLLLGGTPAFAQALPAASADPISTGFQLPTAAGSLQYSLGATESLTSGFYNNSGWGSATGVTGNVAIITSGRQYPFSMIFSGGYFIATANQPSTGYANMGASQVVNTKNWHFILSDSLAYFPATPSPGLSGVPGTGDLGVPPVQLGVDTGQGLLTAYSTRISNAVSLNISRTITGRLSAQGSGSFSVMRFLGDKGVASGPVADIGYGLNDNAYSGTGGLSYAMDARTTFTGTFMYSTFVYQGEFPGFTSKTAMGGVTRSFTRRLTGTLSAGPQWTTTQTTSGPSFTPVPGAPDRTTLGTFIAANLNYSTKFTGYSLGYTQGSNAGYGVTAGAKSESVEGSASRTLARYWRAAVNGTYSRSSAIGNTYIQGFAPNTLAVAAQVSRALGRNFSTYGSYTREKQSGVGNGAVFDVFQGSFQVIGFGITYAPPAIRFGPH